LFEKSSPVPGDPAVLEAVVQSGNALIVAEDIEGEALATPCRQQTARRAQGRGREAPGFGDAANRCWRT